MWRRRFRALGADLEVAADDDLGSAVEPLLSTYEPARGAPVHRLLVGGPGAGAVTLDGEVARVAAERRDAVAHLELELYRLVRRSAEGWLLHAAAVELEGQAWVLAGPSGAGKSTLALGLVARGARYLTDEVVLVEPDLGVRGLARPIAFEAQGAPRSPARGWREHPSEAAAPDGGLVRTVLLAPPAASVVHEARPLGGFVRIAHGAAASYAPEPLGAGRALAALWPCALEGGARALEIATRALAAPAWELATRDVAEACARIEALAAAPLRADSRGSSARRG